ncbi:MAG TPA: ECF transporter S component [Marmoricola sp.]|nr:ECF transporter S component [Marmoricola sp.]
MSSSVGSQRSSGTVEQPRGPVLASRPLLAFRTVDLVSAAMLGVAFGVVFWAWNLIYVATSGPVGALIAPLTSILAGPWLLAGVVGGLLIRRPGAALLTEVVAASVSALIGNEWGWTTVLSGTMQGLGVEVALALFVWKRFGPTTAVLAGALAAVFEVVFYEWHTWLADYDVQYKLIYLAFFVLSGAVVAGLGGLGIVRALARTGAVNTLPAGQEALERSAR